MGMCNQACDKSKYEMVREFHKAFDIVMPNRPTPMNIDQVMARLGFTGEEMVEIIHATTGNNVDFKKYFDDLIRRLEDAYNKQLQKPYPDNVLTAQVDGFLDINYFNHGDFTLLGVNPDEPFKIVHNANMGKLYPDGKPRYNDQGKVIKPDDWIAPEPQLEAEIMRQFEEQLD